MILILFLQDLMKVLIHFVKTLFRQKGDEKFRINKENATFEEQCIKINHV